jgi:membrane-associated phospholipid phosphatase
MKEYPFSRAWNKRKFGFWLIAALLLMGSWLWPFSRSLWDILDRLCFQALNATIAWGKPWAVFWALTGDRIFDYVAAAIVILVFIIFIFGYKKRLSRRDLFLTLFSIIMLGIVIGLQRELISWPRLAPSNLFEGRNSIKEFVFWSRAKETSASSFPGDHATVMMIITVLFWRFFGHKLGQIMLGLTVLFTLPRLAAGAHWLTDDLVGGGFVVLLMLAVIDGTPFVWYLYRAYNLCSNKILGIFSLRN